MSAVESNTNRTQGSKVVELSAIERQELAEWRPECQKRITIEEISRVSIDSIHSGLKLYEIDAFNS